MLPRILSEKEKAVIRAIFDQRANSKWSSIFEYDTLAAQKYLNSIGAFSKLKIDQKRQLDIIFKLTEDKIIKTDYIVDVTFTNNYRKAAKLKPVESDDRYFWYYNTDWAREAFGPNMFTTMEEAGEEYSGSLFINMTVDDMNYIEENYMEDHTVQLAINESDCTLHIKFDKEGWRTILRMDKKTDTFKILLAAYKNAGKVTKTPRKYLEKRVFSRNGTVLALVPILIELDGSAIKLRKSAKITPKQYRHLKKALKIE